MEEVGALGAGVGEDRAPLGIAAEAFPDRLHQRVENRLARMEPHPRHAVVETAHREPFAIFGRDRLQRRKQRIECAGTKRDEPEETIEIAARFEIKQRSGLLDETAHKGGQEAEVPLALHFGVHLLESRRHFAASGRIAPYRLRLSAGRLHW